MNPNVQEQEMRRNVPKPSGVIPMLVNAELPERHVTAFAEFIDNSLGEAAGNAANVEILIEPNRIVVQDDGVGVQNINALTTLGDSYSRLNRRDIGQYGYGAKVATLSLGYDMAIRSVYRGIAHEDRVDWAEVQRTDRWHPTYIGDGKAAKSARDVGTRITITNRHRHAVFQAEGLAERLAFKFRPALIAGRHIFIRQKTGGKFKEFDLRQLASKLRLTNGIRFAGSVNGKPFKGGAGVLHDATQRMNGVHFMWGHRVIVTEHRLIQRHIPAGLYVEVLLGEEWKTSLSANKSGIVQDREELLAAVEHELKALLDSLEKRAHEIFIKGFTFKLTQRANSVFQAAIDNEKGEHAEGSVEARVLRRGEGEGGQSERPTKIAEVAKQARDGGEMGARPAVPARPGLLVNADSLAGPVVTRVSHTQSSVEVTLNANLLALKGLVDRLGEEEAMKQVLFIVFDSLLNWGMEHRDFMAASFPQFAHRVNEGASPWEARQAIQYRLIRDTFGERVTIH